MTTRHDGLIEMVFYGATEGCAHVIVLRRVLADGTVSYLTLAECDGDECGSDSEVDPSPAAWH